jgi:biotin transport system substrate-specific component
MKKSLLRKMLLTALFAAFTAAGAILHIGDASLQSMFSVASGILLGPVWGPMSQLLYVGMGLMGVPIFLEGGGPMYAVHPTFGFLIGMILASFVSGILAEKTEWNIWLVAALGFLSVYVTGFPFLYFISKYYYKTEGMSLFIAFKMAIVYIPMDFGKLCVTAPLSKKLLPVIRKDLYINTL